MEEVHVTNSHIGGEKMFHLLRQRYYWPTLRHDCTLHVQRCFECQLSAGRTHGSWQGQLLPLPAGPRLEWSLDLVTNLGPPNTPKYHMLAAICCFSKFCILRLIPDKTSATVARELRQALIGPFGTPKVFRTDNGTEFAGAVTTLCTTHRITHKRSSPYTSHSNGQVERLHRTVETLLRRALVSLPHERWPDLVPDI